MLVLVISQDSFILLQLDQNVSKHQPVDLTKSGSNRPCQCAPFDLAWRKPSRTLPKCIYVDLGAADGNTLTPFLRDKYGPVANCGSAENPGDYEAFLVEANPHFDAALQQLSATGRGRIHAVNSTAAYMCDASTTFFLDDSVEHNHWGSSMDGKPHTWKLLESDTMDKQEVTVPTMNLLKFLYEQTIPNDWVIVKMDIEGAEWDIVPCLATSPVATLVDQLYMEEHPIGWQLGNTTREEMDLAKLKLNDLGVQLPRYFSPTL
jgi:FkbM family methyltransferase